MNTIGKIFTFTGFGESHGTAIGGVIDGMPAGVRIDLERVQHELDRRRPGQSAITTSRKESDTVEILSGLFEGVTTGCPIGFIIRNENQHSSDYGQLREAFRPSHARFHLYSKNTVCATTVAEGVRAPARPLPVSLPERLRGRLSNSLE